MKRNVGLIDCLLVNIIDGVRSRHPYPVDDDRWKEFFCQRDVTNNRRGCDGSATSVEPDP